MQLAGIDEDTFQYKVNDGKSNSINLGRVIVDIQQGPDIIEIPLGN